jgi:hypothetical protein
MSLDFGSSRTPTYLHQEGQHRMTIVDDKNRNENFFDKVLLKPIIIS